MLHKEGHMNGFTGGPFGAAGSEGMRGTEVRSYIPLDTVS